MDLSELAVFGDDFNDLPLLQNCGIGIAVMNAHPEVKAAASQTCFSNEQDGPAHWIAEVLLKEKPEF
ncbi:HAD family hydrolase [Holdemania filiformis]|uniref:HAD family hydrolase n=1 Tax=Holdemania filiformis TaxID=61171 RepID=UPI00266F2B4B|nr:HAD hydrolase family protein [Holdemania filiformis]